MRQEELRPKRSHSRDSSRSRTARRTRRRSAGALPRRAATDAMPATSTWTTWHGRRNRVHRAISDAITRDHAFWSYRPVSAPTMPGGSIGRCEPIPRCVASGTGRAEAGRVPAAPSHGTSVPRGDSAAGGWTSESSAAQMRASSPIASRALGDVGCATADGECCFPGGATRGKCRSLAPPLTERNTTPAIRPDKTGTSRRRTCVATCGTVDDERPLQPGATRSRPLAARATKCGAPSHHPLPPRPLHDHTGYTTTPDCCQPISKGDRLSDSTCSPKHAADGVRHSGARRHRDLHRPSPGSWSRPFSEAARTEVRVVQAPADVNEADDPPRPRAARPRPRRQARSRAR